MVDAVYLSPPWGGPEYAAQKSFDLEAHMDPNGKHIFRVAQRISPNIAYFLPKHTRTDQVGFNFFCVLNFPSIHIENFNRN